MLYSTPCIYPLNTCLPIACPTTNQVQPAPPERLEQELQNEALMDSAEPSLGAAAGEARVKAAEESGSEISRSEGRTTLARRVPLQRL